MPLLFNRNSGFHLRAQPVEHIDRTSSRATLSKTNYQFLKSLGFEINPEFKPQHQKNPKKK